MFGWVKAFGRGIGTLVGNGAYGGIKGASGWERGFGLETGTLAGIGAYCGIVGDAKGGSIGEGVVEVDIGIALAVVVGSLGAEMAGVTALVNGGGALVCVVVLL